MRGENDNVIRNSLLLVKSSLREVRLAASWVWSTTNVIIHSLIFLFSRVLFVWVCFISGFCSQIAQLETLKSCPSVSISAESLDFFLSFFSYRSKKCALLTYEAFLRRDDVIAMATSEY